MSYKKLGDIVKFISNKNVDGIATILYGINIDKYFMPSVANTIGVDLKKYKVVVKNQFACNRMHVGRDKRLPISMSTFDYPFIVSPAYDVFEVTDKNVIPEYLMLWFRRREFDRQCWFYTDADVRGGLSLDALKSIEIRIPSIEKQREIVAQYQAVENKIKVNEQICEKLEATAQTLYYNTIKENHCKEILLKELCSFQEGYVNPSQEHTRYFNGNIKWLRANDVNGGFILNTSRTLTEEGFKSAGTSALLFSPNTMVITKSGTIGRLGILCDYMCGNRAVINIKPNDKDCLPFIFFVLKTKYNELIDMAVGSAQANLYVPILASLKINLPDKENLDYFNLNGNNLLELIKSKTQENQKLTQLQSLLLSRLARLEG